MSKSKRIILFCVFSLFLLGIYFFSNGKLVQDSNLGIVLFTSLLMLSFLSLLVEHLFSRPSDVIASSLSILLLIIPIRNSLDRLGILYDIFIVYNSVMIIFAILSLYLVDSSIPPHKLKNKLAYLLKEISTSIGNGKLLYFILFFVTLIYYIDAKSIYFFLLLLYSITILIAEPQKGIIRSFNWFKRANKIQNSEIGQIFSVQSQNTYLVKAHKDISFNEFDLVEFNYLDNCKNTTYLGLVLKKYFLDEQQWIKILRIKEIDHNEVYSLNKIYKSNYDDVDGVKKQFIGIIDAYSTIHRIKFIYNSNVKIFEGMLLGIAQGDKEVLYQVVEATTKIEKLEDKNEAGDIIGEAIQIGVWNNEKKTFEKYGWVPCINTPVYLAKPFTEEIKIGKDEYVIGNIPETKYPVVLDKITTVTHHLGVFGATGCGKSVFTRNLVRNIIESGTKVICVDFTNEYFDKFQDIKRINLINEEEEKKIFLALDIISDEMDKFANQRDKAKIDTQSNGIDNLIFQKIKEFYSSDNVMCILSLPEVSNTSGVIEYTKRFFKVAFDIAKKNKNFDNRVCIVIEEAHTVIPEFTFSGIDDKISKPLVNTISQIALQGRKYDIGFIIIAQRTANVSKSVITQCNSIISFKQFDNTSKDFLANYMGKDLVNTLSNLKFKQAIACGKAFKADIPLIFEVPDIKECTIE